MWNPFSKKVRCQCFRYGQCGRKDARVWLKGTPPMCEYCFKGHPVPTFP